MLIFICDDSQQERAALQKLFLKTASDLSVDIEISVYSSGKALLKAVEDGIHPVLAVLDIYMEGMNGIETGRSLRAVLPEVFLVFLTASRDFAVDAFEMDALHYMVKPVTEDMLRTLFKRLASRLEKTIRILELPIGRGRQIQLPIAKISQITSKSRGIEICVQGRSSTWLPCLFREAEARLLDEPDFLLLSRGCMVNLNSIQKIDYDLCYLKNGDTLRISRRERSKVQSRYSDFLFCKMNEAKKGNI